jgi:hypothetical protein
MAKYYGITLCNVSDAPCTECSLGKIHVKNFGHNNSNKATYKGEQISIDISSVQNISFGGAKFWLLIQDEYTNYLWSYFLSAKSELSNIVQAWIKLFQKTHNTTVKYICCDNAGKNTTLQKDLEADESINVQFEFTAPYSPQQNGKVKQKFATLWGKV